MVASGFEARDAVRIDSVTGASIAGAVPSVRSTEPRLRHIDALRAIAALLVVWLHVGDAFVRFDPRGIAAGNLLYLIPKSIDVGRIGVVVFFLISGFVIPFSIHPDRAAPIGSFVIKRLFRIYPAYWLSVPLGALTGFWIWGAHFSAPDVLINLTLLQDVFGVQGAEGLYWTLLVEIVFYALCVALLLGNSLFNMRRVCALAIVLGFGYSFAMLATWIGAPVMNANAAFWMVNLSTMLCGTLYRSCVVDNKAAADPWLRAAVYGLLSYYLVILPSGAIWAHGFEHNAPISYALGLLVFILGTSAVRIRTRLTDWLGQISYSVYLFHPVIFMTLLWWLLRQPPGSWWRSQHLSIYLLINTVLTIALADLVYRLIEKPSIRLGHRYAHKWALRAKLHAGGVDLATTTSVAVSERVARLTDQGSVPNAHRESR